jgi:hypothetical protein
MRENTVIMFTVSLLRDFYWFRSFPEYFILVKSRYFISQWEEQAKLEQFDYK